MKNNQKSLRRVFAAFLCIVMTLPLGIVASAEADEKAGFLSGDSVMIWGYRYDCADVSIKDLTDTKGNCYYLFEIGSEAYYIYDPVSEKFLEGSPCAPSPYLGLNDTLVYVGPMNYFCYNQATSLYSHTVLGDINVLNQTKMASLQDSFDTMLTNVREVEDAQLHRNADAELRGIYDNMIKDDDPDSGYVDYYITSYKNIVNATYPPNSTNISCGYVAATLVLYYWHKRLGGIIPSSYLSSTGKLSATGTTVDDNLRLKLESLGNGGESWALEIRDVLLKYCKKQGIGATATYYLGAIGYRDELQNNRPAILFGLFPNVQNGGTTKHAVTAYGFHVPYDGQNSGTIVHYGWSGYSMVILDSGLIGSVTLFDPT